MVVVGLLVWALRIVLGLEFSLFRWVCWTKQKRGGRGSREGIGTSSLFPQRRHGSRLELSELCQNGAPGHGSRIRGHGGREEGEGVPLWWLRAWASGWKVVGHWRP